MQICYQLYDPHFYIPAPLVAQWKSANKIRNKPFPFEFEGKIKFIRAVKLMLRAKKRYRENRKIEKPWVLISSLLMKKIFLRSSSREGGFNLYFLRETFFLISPPEEKVFTPVIHIILDLLFKFCRYEEEKSDFWNICWYYVCNPLQ